MKPTRVVLSEDVLSDLMAGRDFYERKGSGLGIYFITSLLSDITSLRLFSGVHPLRFGYHRMLSKRFPFAIYYEVSGNTTRVVAVLDLRRDPGIIQKAILDR
jgi:hypothetical protein